jgi:NAD+ kinase
MKIAFVASPKPIAQNALEQARRRYDHTELRDAEYIVALGGDGIAIRALNIGLQNRPIPVFAMRLEGSVGFLGNPFGLDDLPRRLRAARMVKLRPLKGRITDVDGRKSTVFGINEIALVRRQLQVAKMRITIGTAPRFASLIGDGVIISTPIGSTGYNRSAGGPVLPPDSALLALTGLTIRPNSDWSNTVVPDNVDIDIEILDPTSRPVRLETSLTEILGIGRVQISSACEHEVMLLRDPL